jgi:hypothetical protein
MGGERKPEGTSGELRTRTTAPVLVVSVFRTLWNSRANRSAFGEDFARSMFFELYRCQFERRTKPV